MAQPRENAATISNEPLAIDRIAELTRRGEKAEIIHIDTKGLGDGLPPSIPALLYPGPSAKLDDVSRVIESYRQNPKRRRGEAIVSTLESFIDLVNRHKDAGSVIFAKTAWPKPKLTAVIDYHDVERKPRHGEHRITYPFPITEELTAWIENDAKPMKQDSFAAFLEDHAAELAAPLDQERTDYEPLFKEKFAVPVDLINLSRELEVFVGATVKQGQRLSSGERTVHFVEEHMNGNGEKIEIPGIFMISVPAFVDGDPVRIPARLRYRIANGTIAWFYQLYRWEFWLRDQVQQDLAKAAKKTELPAFEGAPEA
jgi:uncharacterized protein YfdQ (DUF2303 family)